jgi:hypothetical protein
MMWVHFCHFIFRFFVSIGKGIDFRLFIHGLRQLKRIIKPKNRLRTEDPDPLILEGI